jgi:glycosyltransferase involved in cell wall biosynthesis
MSSQLKNSSELSVVLCTYNGALYLARQLESIFDQSVPVSEILVCDDNSDDGTLDILEEFDKKKPGILKIYKNVFQLGAINNFEKAIQLCSGSIVFLADQDDIWEKEKVEKMLRVFDSKKHVELIFTDGQLINDKGEFIGSTLWEKWDFNAKMRYSWRNNVNAFYSLYNNNNRATGATIAFRRELLQNVGDFKVPIDFWHDALLALHAAALNGLYFIEEPLIRYRIHSGQQVGITQGSNFNHQLRAQAIPVEEFQARIKSQYPKLFNPWYCKWKSLKNRLLSNNK